MPVRAELEPLETRRLLTAVVSNEEVSDFGASEFADDVVVQKNDRVLVVGHTENDPQGNRLFLARYDVDGTLDPFFGEDGRIFGEFAELPRATSMALDRSGRIFVAGVTVDPNPVVAVVRFTSSGFLDRSFGNGGIAKLDAGEGETVADVAVDSSGRVVVAGQVLVGASGSPNARPGFLVARFDFNGQPDTTFGGGDDFAVGDGVTAFTVGGGDSGATSVLLDGNTRIFVAGFGTEQQAGESPERRFTLARLDQFGTLDDDFGEGGDTGERDGVVTLDIGLPAIAQGLALAKNGKVVAAGNTIPTFDAPGEQFVVARFDRGGQVDPNFGGGDGFNIATFAPALSQIARDVAVDSKDRIFVAGEVSDAGEPTGDFNDDQFLLARFLPDGAPDAAFAPGGGLVHEVRTGVDSIEQVAGLAIQREGKDQRVVVAGNAGNAALDQDLALLRVATEATQGSGNVRVKKTSLLVRGTDHNDTISVSPNFAAGTIEVNVNGVVQNVPGAAFTRIGIRGLDGDDEITCSVGGDVITTIEGNDDDDDLRFFGDAHGTIEGGDDDDDIVGGPGRDRLRGGDDDDILFGGDGNDDIEGGEGFDELFGEDGDDELKADDGWHDDVDGGSGDDDAKIDFFDFVTRVDDVDVR